MGTYIKKALGYGLTVKQEEIESTLNLDALDNRDSLRLEDYTEYLKKLYPEAARDEKDFISSDLYSLTKEELPEAGLTGFDFISVVDMGENEDDEGDGEIHLVITPYRMLKEWKHFDDAIDYYEAEHEAAHTGKDGDSMVTSMKFFDHGLFPYDSRYLNLKTGKLVDRNIYRDALHYGENTPLSLTPKALLEGVEYLNTLYSILDVENGTDLKENIRLLTPAPARDYAAFSGIFKNPETCKYLKPALLTYWS